MKVLRYCISASELVGLAEGLITLMRKAPASQNKAVAERLGQLVDELLALIDHMQQPHHRPADEGEGQQQHSLGPQDRWVGVAASWHPPRPNPNCPTSD